MEKVEWKINSFAMDFEKQAKQNEMSLSELASTQSQNLQDQIAKISTQALESQKLSSDKVSQIESEMKQAILNLKSVYEKRMNSLEKKKILNLERKVTFHEEKLKESESFCKNLNSKMSEKYLELSKPPSNQYRHPTATIQRRRVEPKQHPSKPDSNGHQIHSPAINSAATIQFIRERNKHSQAESDYD